VCVKLDAPKKVKAESFQEKKAREKREREAAAAAKPAISISQVLSNPFELKTPQVSSNPFEAPPPALMVELKPVQPIVEVEAASESVVDEEPVVDNNPFFAAPPPPEPEPEPEPEPAPAPAPVVEVRAKPPPPAPVQSEEERLKELAQRAFAFDKLPQKQPDARAEAPLPQREIGELYEENPWLVNQVNPFKEQKSRSAIPYNPFAPNAVKAVATATVASPSPGPAGSRAPPPPPGATAKKINKNRPPPSKTGLARLAEGKGSGAGKGEKRSFELVPTGYLHYYKKEGDKKPLGSFFLKGNPVRLDEDRTGFTVQADQVVYTVRCQSEAEAQEWLDDILFYV